MEQLESYFVANNNTTAAKKRAVLLSLCGTAMYKIIRSVVTPEKPTKVSYADLTTKDKEAEDCVYTMLTMPSAKQDLIKITVMLTITHWQWNWIWGIPFNH